MLRTSILVALLLFGGVALAQSQGPSPPIGKQGQTQPEATEQKPAAQPQPAAQPPITVNVIPAPKTEAQRAEEAHERQEKADLDRRLVAFTADLATYTARLYYATLAVAIATIFLVLATVGLVSFGFIQSRDMKASVAASEDAAKAAQRSADISEQAFRRLERPYLLVKITDTTRLRNPIYGLKPNLEYTLVNYGKLPAILRSVSIGLQNNPPYPLRTPMAIAEKGYEVIPAGGELLNGRVAEVIGSHEEQRFVGAQASLLILHGLIEYEDPTGAVHMDSFCMRGLNGGSAFTIDGSEEYNWHKTEYPKKPG